jgi:hypothetical protein
MTMTMISLDLNFIKHHKNTIDNAIEDFFKITSFLYRLKENMEPECDKFIEIMGIIKYIEKINDELIKENEYLITKLKGVSHE